jgi:hypothetical protein
MLEYAYAIWQRKPKAGLIMLTDRGSQWHCRIWSPPVLQGLTLDNRDRIAVIYTGCNEVFYF